jgi:hypothetical protein
MRGVSMTTVRSIRHFTIAGWETWVYEYEAEVGCSDGTCFACLMSMFGQEVARA